MSNYAVELQRQITELQRDVERLKCVEKARFVGARVYNSANLSIPNSTGTTLTFNSERYDTDGFHSTSVNTGRFTIPSGYDGYYFVSAHVRFAASATGQRHLYLSVNGATVVASARMDAAASDVTDISISTSLQLVATQYVEAFVIQSSGGALNVQALSAFSPEFTIFKI